MTKRSTGAKSPAARKKTYAATKKKSGTRSRPTKKKSSSRRRKKSSWDKISEAVFSGQTLGVVLAVLGIFTLLALFSSQRGSVTAWWIDLMSMLFGVGVYLLPVALIISGIFIFLYSQGHRGSFTLTRFFGFLLLWVTTQALIQLVSVSRGADAPISSPRPGDYGGLVGWLLVQPLASVLGQGITMLLMVVLFILAVILLFGVSWNRLMLIGAGISTSLVLGLQALGGRLRSGWPAVTAGIAASWHHLRSKMSRDKTPPIPPFTEPEVVTTLPPDPDLVPAATPAPPVRIIGGEDTEWRLPSIDEVLDVSLSGEITEEDLAERARIIEETLNSFGVPVNVVEVNKGPVVTQFGVKPGYIIRRVRGEEKRMKVKVSKIQGLSNDLSLALAASPIRIEAPVPGRNIVGIEVPNQSISMVTLRSILESEEFEVMKAPLKIALGQDVSGRAVAASLARMPHLLIAGATGSGKSVCVNAIICSLLFQYTPDDMKFIMVDPKRVELTIYNGIPHLIDDVITDVETVVAVLGWAVREMENRYKKLQKAGARNIEAYNARMVSKGKPKMSYTVIVIDELADIMMMAPDEVEKLIVRLAQMARAVGIHLVLATQRPSVNVVTGLIKANFPSRIAFAVTSQIDSRVILDTPGAEKLLGRGDMLFMRPDSAKLARLQGAFVSDGEVHRLVRYWRGQRSAGAEEVDEGPVTQRPLWEDVVSQAKTQAKRDVLYDEAVRVVQESGRASVSLLQRRLQIGYSRAARIIDQMEEDGLIGPDLGGSRGREVFITAETESAGGQEQPPTGPGAAQEHEPPPWDDFDDDDEWDDPSEEI
jgi:S-DNA-T family DNA segregation ATPase FtsK/SpoIIIE